jgi:hypothetical protein
MFNFNAIAAPIGPKRHRKSSVRLEPMKFLTGHGERVQTSRRDDGKSDLSQLAQQGRIK